MAATIVAVALGVANPSVSVAHADPVVSEFSVPAHPEEIVGGPDGSLWYTNPFTDSVDRITTAGVLTRFALPSIPGPFSITVGPDGALWFTITPPNGATAGYIGRITTSGVVTEYPLSGTLAPINITTGPDGALWFTEVVGDGSGACGPGQIGRITTLGVISQFAYPSMCPSLGGITAGPDGSLWVAEYGGNISSTGSAIAKVTTAGVVTRYPISKTFGPYPGPSSITAGPDGALWFTDPGNGHIGRITTDGDINEFANFSGGVRDITSGPDGALWFSDYGQNKIGRIDTSGAVTEYPVPSGGQGNPMGITTGADGAIWFTEYTANKIARITTPTSLVSATDAGGSGAGRYSADSGFSGGSSYSSGETVDTSQVQDPAPQLVYQSARYGNAFSYSYSGLTPGATYTVRLDFNELYWGTDLSGGGGIGSRVFNVTVNGDGALTNFDIYAAAGGSNRAITEQLPATADSAGNIVVSFASVVDNAMVNGVALYRGALPPLPATPLVTSAFINAGGASAGSFSADNQFSSGTTYSSSASVDTTQVANPAPQEVYQSVRYGTSFAYTLSDLAPNAPFLVTLDFDELYWGTALAGNSGGVGSRVFNVAIQGQQDLNNFDIFAVAGGANRAIAEQFPATSDSNGRVTIQFSTVTDNAMVSGIELTSN